MAGASVPVIHQMAVFSVGVNRPEYSYVHLLYKTQLYNLDKLKYILN